MNIESKRTASIKAPSFSALAQARKDYTERTGLEVIDFSIGSSNIPPAECVKQALAEASLEDDSFQYNLGPTDEMIETIQSWYRERYDTVLEKDEIAVLKGSQEALAHLPLAFVDEDEYMLIPDPHYPIYGAACGIAGCRVWEMPLKKENGYLPDFGAIPEDVLKKAKLILVSYPSNPTGAAAPDSFYEELIEFARKNKILVVHDNAYSELLFTGRKGRSFLSFPRAKEIGIELNSLSKSWSFGGARFAVMVGNREMIAVYRKLIDMMDFGGFPAVQKAAMTALNCAKDFPETVCREYQRRRDDLIEKFKKAGWQIEPSEGTMFVWAPIPENYEDSWQFTMDLLEKAGVLAHPGTSFGSEGRRYVRLALVRSDEEVSTAAERIRKSGLMNFCDTEMHF